MSENEPDTRPEYYERPLLEESRDLRARLERQRDELEDEIDEVSNVIERIRKNKKLERLEYMLSWQGADPRDLDRDEMREVNSQPLYEDSLVDKYRARVKNPATAIRAYCIDCQGGSIAGVRDCTSLTCPLWNFRMGRDPLRGYERPPYIEPELEEDEDFEEEVSEDDDDDEDAEE